MSKRKKWSGEFLVEVREDGSVLLPIFDFESARPTHYRVAKHHVKRRATVASLGRLTQLTLSKFSVLRRMWLFSISKISQATANIRTSTTDSCRHRHARRRRHARHQSWCFRATKRFSSVRQSCSR